MQTRKEAKQGQITCTRSSRYKETDSAIAFSLHIFPAMAMLMTGDDGFYGLLKLALTRREAYRAMPPRYPIHVRMVDTRL